MTRIFTDGAEMADTLFFSVIDGVTAPAITGGYAYLFGYDDYAYKNIDAVDELYFRQRLYVNKRHDNNIYVAFRYDSTVYAQLYVDSLYRWVIKIGSTTVDTSIETCVLATWYLVELYYKIDDVAGEFTLRIDGNAICTFSGDTKPSTYTTINNVYWYSGELTSMFYIDDLGFNDTAGGSDDSWCGGGHVTKITPTGNGSTTEWTGSDADAVNNYLLVDEYPLDSDTTYVYEDAAATGDLDQYAMSDDYSGTGRTVKRIWAECRARKTSADAATLKIGFDTGASVNTDDVGTLWQTYIARCVGAEYTTNPDDAGAWEEADIDALEFVAEVG